MSIRREWLDWSKPCLPQAAAWLVDHAATDESEPGAADLRDVICVVPGRRASRVLLGELIGVCAKRNLRLLPPRVCTPGPMVDAILGVDVAVAGEWEIRLAWIAALRGCDAEVLKALIPQPPDQDDLAGWDDLATTIAMLHDELAGGRVAFERVVDQTRQMQMETEAARWESLLALRDAQRRVLRKHGLTDPHAARETALHDAGREPGGSVVLIGVADLNAIQRAAVELVPDRSTALIFAPESLAGTFDSVGCVLPQHWCESRIDIADDQLILADRPEDQAKAAISAIAGLEGGYGPDEITIGLGDEQMAPTIARHARWAGLEVHSPSERTLGNGPVGQLLEAAAAWLDDPRFSNLAALLRHPDVEAWIAKATPDANVRDWLSVLDKYFTEHLNQRLSANWLGDAVHAGRMKAAHDAVVRLLSGVKAGLRSRPLGAWGQPILDLLAEVFGERDEHTPAGQRVVEACITIRDALSDIAMIPPDLQPEVCASEAIGLVMTSLRDEPLTTELDPQQVEMLGWLELPLDVSPVLVLTGCNDGAIPETGTADAFLPDSLRSEMGLMCNHRRHARDAYAMRAILHSRKRVKIIAGRRGADGDPLTPSRLLLACEEDTLVGRISRMCGSLEPEGVAGLPIGLSPRADANVARAFVVPPIPDDLPLPQTMSVTSFKAYLSCPYRFALERLLDLQSMDDEAAELDPLGFGSLAHEVLRRFGESHKAAKSSNADTIAKFLMGATDEHAREMFGSHPLASVRLQLARLKERFRNFANVQAAHRAKGWVIHEVETTFPDGTMLDIPGAEPMPLTGKIDRIDLRESDGNWMIIDYKTGDSARPPQETHRESKEPGAAWIDLQLPLYRHVFAQRGVTGMVALAYFVLPKAADETGLLEAEWTEEDLSRGVQQAREIVQLIRARRFERNTNYDSVMDRFARICQAAAFGRDDEGDRADGPVTGGGE